MPSVKYNISILGGCALLWYRKSEWDTSYSLHLVSLAFKHARLQVIVSFSFWHWLILMGGSYDFFLHGSWHFLADP